nr:class I adenylate-forming enzyme family protein [Acanthopleuribacter pedis]
MLHAYRLEAKCFQKTSYSAGAVLTSARRAATVLRRFGLRAGDRQLHVFGANQADDLILRLAAVMCGTVPVTVNWQADDAARIRYKAEAAGVALVLDHPSFDGARRAALAWDGPRYTAFDWAGEEPLAWEAMTPAADRGETRLIIFTSGTTGTPKGVALTYQSYFTNQATFRRFMQVDDAVQPHLVTVNPLHHANSSAVCDWGLRESGAQIHLLERYSGDYWRVLFEVAEANERVVAPAVARHIDFLAGLAQEDRLPCEPARFRAALQRCDLLLGSAPVGPTTVARVRQFTGRTPLVRFGSTETCLQVMGIPRDQPATSVVKAFERGWDGMESQSKGYYIGRPHPPFTEVKVVRHTDGPAAHWPECEPGECGYLVTRGGNLMRGYIGNAEATAAVLVDGWYSGLKDVGFYLLDEGGERDFYWASRASTLLIRGGANYAYDQVANDIKTWLLPHFGWDEQALDLTVIGLRVDSEHEDACILILHDAAELDEDRRAAVAAEILAKAKAGVPKGSAPDYVCWSAIPRNFKGAVNVPQLKKEARAWLEAQGKQVLG